MDTLAKPPAPGPGYVWDEASKTWVPMASTANELDFKKKNLTSDGSPKLLGMGGSAAPTASYMNELGMGSMNYNANTGMLAKARMSLTGGTP